MMSNVINMSGASVALVTCRFTNNSKTRTLEVYYFTTNNVFDTLTVPSGTSKQLTLPKLSNFCINYYAPASYSGLEIKSLLTGGYFCSFKSNTPYFTLNQ